MDVLIPLQALTDALARVPAALRGTAPPLAASDGAVEAFLEDLARDRLFVRGPHPRLGSEMRVPPPPRDVAFRRLVLIAAGIVADPAVAPAVRLSLAYAGSRGQHAFRRIASVAEGLQGHVDPAAPLENPVRGEEFVRRVAASFQLSIEGETPAESAARLAAVDARNAARAAREAEERRRQEEIERALAAAAERPAPVKITPD
jgi:hypothetical protein